MPSTLQVDKIIDGSATTNKELAEYASSAWSWGAGVPVGSVLQGGIIDLPAVVVNCNDSNASGSATIAHNGGGSLLGDTTITPKLNSSKFLFHLCVHVDASASPLNEKVALWHTKDSSNTLIIETYWYRRVSNDEPLPHVGTGFINNTDGNSFTVKLRGYTNNSENLIVGRLNNYTTGNKTSSIVFYEVQT